MTIFLILAPYGAFATLMLVSPAVISLFASAAIGLLVTAYDAFRGRSIKVLGAGSVILFAALGGILAARDEHRLRNGIAGGQQIFAEARSLAVDMDDA